MQRVKLTIKYDGEGFSGWQRQKNTRSVQQEIENSLSKIFGKNVEVTGASRTDAKVHALGQVAHFDYDGQIPVEKLKEVINSHLPSDVRIVEAKPVKNSFNARFDVKKKTYFYLLNVGEKDPLVRNYAAQLPVKLDPEKMAQACQLLSGTHDFRAFCSAHSQVREFTRTIYKISIRKKKNFFIFTFTGNGFMQHMIRILVGTIVEVGSGKKSLEGVSEALKTGDKTKVGKNMPGCGLFLKKIYY